MNKSRLYHLRSKHWLTVLLVIIACPVVNAQQYNPVKVKIKLAKEIKAIAATNDIFAVTDGQSLTVISYQGNVSYGYTVENGSVNAMAFLLVSNDLLVGITEKKDTPAQRFIIKQFDPSGILKQEFVDTTLTQELADAFFENNTVGARNAINYVRPSVLHLGGVRELQAPQVKNGLSHVEIIQSIAVSPGHNKIASLDKYNLLKVWDTDGKILKTFYVGNDRLRTNIYFHTDSTIFIEPNLLLNTQDTSVSVIPVTKEYSTIPSYNNIYFYFTGNPDGNQEKLYTLATADFKELNVNEFYTVAGAGANNRVALLGADGLIRVIDEAGNLKSIFGKAKSEIITFRNKQITRYSKIKTIGQSPDGKFIVSGDEKGKAIIWRVEQ